ncbi:MAG: type II toxin-antitoxin system YafQ family toxin [Prevotella sp.]|nr:type II toxin-antitoxin system YafQ family toxin [Prevotella sp.]MCF0207821.1 type II toxin-antitoxin system YafQ family toxin [Bacteroidaceae bacterium]
MRYFVETSKHFDKAFKKCIKRGLDINAFREVIAILADTGTLPSRYRPHKLSGNYAGCWECHIKSDWLLIWEQNDLQLTLLLIDTGTHSDLF